MVPRDKTAYWVERVLHEWSDKSPRTALDLYAGSGNIGIALLKHLSTLHTTFSEVDASLLSGIQASLTLNQIDPARATLLAGDSLAPIHGRFDILCANPPYLDPALEADMDPEMLHEPRVAFFGSSDGYLHHRELIEHGRDYLTPHGVLYVECDMTQEDTLTNLVKKSDWQYEFWNDEFGNPGTLVLRQ
jgi:HemK-like putative methylase